MCRENTNQTEYAEQCLQCDWLKLKCNGRFNGRFWPEDCPASDEYLPQRIGGE